MFFFYFGIRIHTPSKRNKYIINLVLYLQRLEMRAKKFGVPLSDTAKKEARAARFNITSDTAENGNKSKSAASIKNSQVVRFFMILSYKMLKNISKTHTKLKYCRTQPMTYWRREQKGLDAMSQPLWKRYVTQIHWQKYLWKWS